MGSFYDLLGVQPNATELEIRSAYGRDVLRLQESPTRNMEQIRATLDAAFATLVDPARRAAYDAQLANAQTVAASDDDSAFIDARNGGLWFAAGALVTAATYTFSDNTYILAWGPLLFGGFQLLRGLAGYVRLPAAARQSSQVLMLAGLIAVGLTSAGWVGFNEALGAQESAQRNSWNSTVDATDSAIGEASTLVAGVFTRSGSWTEQDSVEMGRASALYAQVADAMSASSAPSRLEWYRAGMAKNFRDAADITRDYSLLTPNAARSAIEALDRRWQARLDGFDDLTERFDAQEGP
jgi:curved DNA-binding protein CbpA